MLLALSSLATVCCASYTSWEVFLEFWKLRLSFLETCFCKSFDLLSKLRWLRPLVTALHSSSQQSNNVCRTVEEAASSEAKQDAHSNRMVQSRVGNDLLTVLKLTNPYHQDRYRLVIHTSSNGSKNRTRKTRLCQKTSSTEGERIFLMKL